MTMRAAPNHDTEHLSEIRRIHHHNGISGFQNTRLNHCQIHLLLHPLLAPFHSLSDLSVGLFAVSIAAPQLLHLRSFLLSYFAMAGIAEPELSPSVRTKPFKITRSATRTYFSWCIGKNPSISVLVAKKNPSFQQPKFSIRPND